MEHFERRKLASLNYVVVVLCAFMVALLSPVTACAEDAYFSVSTDRTFRPGEKATVHLYARGVQALEFRLYRVSDPVQFFEKLGDVHGFGQSSVKEQIDQESWIEKFHDWKQAKWHEIRNFFRRQFSAHSRTEIREAQGNARKHKTEAALFAQVPLLNNKQLVARWRQEMPPSYFSEHQDVPVEKLERGVYVIEATDGSLRAYTIVLVTQLAMVTKSAPGQMLAFTVDRTTGAPVANTSVELWANRKTQAAAKTDAQGLAQIALSSEHLSDVRLLGLHDQDVALVAPEFFNISSSPAEDWTGYVYTDRPIYRPGHTVHLKAILRKRNGERYAVPAGEQVTVKVEDTTSKQVYQTNVFVSAFGSVHGDFTLPQDAALGYYSITIRSTKGDAGEAAQYGMNGGFRVEEYKKPEYDVHVIPDKPRVLQGDSITATIQAKYFFGEPVAGAEVKYSVHRAMAWSYLFGDEDQQDESEAGHNGDDEEGGEIVYEYAGDQLSEKSGKLDANGQLKITIPTTVDKGKKDFRYRIEAKITDESRREISGHESVLATYGSFQVGVQTDKYMYHPGDTISLTAAARDYSGKPVQTAFRVELVHREYGRNAGETVVASRDGETDATGRGSLQITAQDGGSIVRITAQTPEGRQIEGDTWLWIASPGIASWEGGRSDVQIIPDRKSYKAGDTANLLIMTKDSTAHLLVTTEARTLQTRQVVKATGSSTMVSVPITKEDEPNVHVAVAFVSQDTLYNGNKNLKVPADEQKLNITIEPSQPQFKPGEAARYNIVASDASGKPAVGEFSIGVVDEAIYAIQPDSSGDIDEFFYGQKYDRVSTLSSLSFYFQGEAGNKPFPIAGGGGGGNFSYSGARLAQLKPSEPLVQPKVRKVFPDTALWLGEIKTDQAGHAQAQLSFPDSLTTWRATIRGATLDTKVGSAINRVIVRKNFMVRLAVPRFFRQGDDVTVSTIVHNYLGTDKNAQVSLETKGLDLQDAGARQATVASKGDQRQDWHVHAQNVRESDVLAKALTNEESDALELTLPVIPFGVKLSESKSGAISSASGQEQTTINLPGDKNTAAPTLSVSVSPSIAGSIFGALDYLTSYPYGCTEQTMSSFLPDIVVANAMKDLKLESTINTPELEKKIRAGLDRLYDFQHEDGGWGWWKEDESMVFMSAYVVSGLAQAKGAGYDVQENALNKGKEYLRNQLDKHARMKADLRAYAVYALALAKASDSDMLNTVYGARSDMSAQGIAMLGLAMHTSGDSRANEVAAQLEKVAVSEGDVVYWRSDFDSLLEFYIDDSAETTAYAMRLLSLTHPDSPLLPKAATWLVSHRDGGYFWISTKQTAMVVFGLLEYVKISHELDADFTADVFVNDKKVLSKHFTREDSMKSDLPKIYLTQEQLRSGANSVRVQKSGAGKLYWSARGEYYSAEKKLFQNNKLSLSIMRDYYRLAPQQKDEKIVYNLEPLSGEVHSGDVIAVRLSVNGSPWRYLLVEDPIPAGAEFVQHDNLYELNTKIDWWGFWFTRREFHDDHAAFFQTYFSGHQEYVYLLKIVNPGKFRISPASVQPMYQPSVISTTDAASMEVK